MKQTEKKHVMPERAQKRLKEILQRIADRECIRFVYVGDKKEGEKNGS